MLMQNIHQHDDHHTASTIKKSSTDDQNHHQLIEECTRMLNLQDYSVPAPGWTAHLAKDGRFYYCNHITKTAGWLPPVDVWKSGKDFLPYGWERAVDDTGKSYYINHLNKTTTYEIPICRIIENLPKPLPRTITLERSTNLGFGFVAGSEKPVIVRFVTEGGPSANKLLPGDQILSVNGEDVKSAPREHVISLVRSCNEKVTLEVCQPLEQQGVRKSTFLSALKKARLKSKPSRVRFAESVCVNGAPLFPPSAFSLGDICIPQMANVLKVFLENGQTKSFKYDAWTTVQDVINSLQSKLCVQASEYFSLVVEHIKSLKRNKLTLLDPQDSIAKIASQPGAHKLRCLFRVTFVPTTAASLAQRDLNALDYLYSQCCNDVIQERFSPELQYDTALRLAALHMYQHALGNNMQANKLTVKIAEKEFGLERFIPASVLDNLKRKEIRKLLGHFLKLYSNMTGSGKPLTSLQVKLHYLDITSQLPSYGAKCFSAGPKGDLMEKVILVSPKFGISQIMGHRNSFQPVPLANLETMRKIQVRSEDEITKVVLISLDNDKMLEISLDEKDAIELVLVLKGYFKLITTQELAVDQEKCEEEEIDDLAPPYVAQHKVIPEKWSYMDQQSLKTTYFTVLPQYQNVNKKTNGLYNTVGRHANKQSLLLHCDLDGNMNNSLSNRNHQNGSSELLIHQNWKPISSEFSIEMEKVFNNWNEDQDSFKRITDSAEWQETSVDFDSDSEEAAGRLKHSDSLIFLNKIHKDDNNSLNATKELLRQLQSESDNDSLYTPHDSPKLKKDCKLISSSSSSSPGNSLSFGLRSPNNLDNDNSQNFQEYLKKICDLENNTLSSSKSNILNSINEIFVFDPDIIDLTNIPPPLTPDELDATVFPPSLIINVPPKSFADSIERLNEVLDLNENQDLEDFLAKVSVPPPTQKITPAMELTPEEIMAYIIPPPPERLSFECEDNLEEISSSSSSNLVKNKSTLHDVLKRNNKLKIEEPSINCKEIIVKLPPRRSIDERPPERPPKESKFSRNSLEEEMNNKEIKLPAPELPPRLQPSNLLRPILPPKKQLPQLPLNINNDDKELTLKNVKTAVATPTYSSMLLESKLSTTIIPIDIDDENLKTEKEDQELTQVLAKTDFVLGELLSRLKKASIKCLGCIENNGDGALLLEKRMQRTKEELTNQSLQLVTSSKQLVIAMSEPLFPKFLENLTSCLTTLKKLTDLCQDLVLNTTTAPLQTRNLIMNICDVVEGFRTFLTSSIDRSAPKTVEEHLALHAEALAHILSNLLKHLRVFPS